MEPSVIVVFIVGSVTAFCYVCHKITTWDIRPQKGNYEEHQCRECNVITKYKVK